MQDVSADEALSYVLGYCVANDVSARRWQGKKGGSQWYRCKSFDTFGPMGPELVCLTQAVGQWNRVPLPSVLLQSNPMHYVCL
jgi:2-keto-4-pentenoate hydratase/2-oxohepta-3-ene-1,7-dioic acid hydratase in catechol pathway